MSDVNHTGMSYEIPLHTPETRLKIVASMEYALRDKRDQFDGFVVQGYSMTIIGSILAHEMGKQLAIVRKPDDDRNSFLDTEGKHNQRWVFADDLISSGKTFNRVKDGLKPIQGTIVGVALWHSGSDTEHIKRITNTPVWMKRHLVDEWYLERKAREAELLGGTTTA